MPSIARFIVQSLFDALVDRGCPPDRLRECADLPGRFGVPFLPYTTLDDLMSAGVELTGDPILGLHVAGAITPEAGGSLGLLILASPDVGSALERSVRFERLISDVHRISVVDEPGRRGLRIDVPDPTHPGASHVVDWMLADQRVITQRLTGQPISPSVVRIRRPPPEDPSPYRHWFQAPIEWEAEHNELLMPEEAWRTPVVSASKTFRAIFETQTQRALDRLPVQRSRADRVRQLIHSQLPRALTLERAARTLRISPRTLQRSLKNEGTSFSALIDETRQNEAQRLLSSGVAIAEVSWALGYSEPSAFHRAFRRWFGVTPGDWRQGAP